MNNTWDLVSNESGERDRARLKLIPEQFEGVVLACGTRFEHVQQPHNSTIALIRFIENNYDTSSGFGSIRIQTIPGIEFSCSN